jgi:hypothetical protein
MRSAPVATRAPESKSFLLLFFKKEGFLLPRPECSGRKPKGGETLMIFLNWAFSFWCKMKFEFEAGFNKHPK